MAATDEPMPGTAAHDRAFLLVEHPGPWGRKALAESRLPEHVRTGLAKAADVAGVRVQLIRRHRRAMADQGLRVFGAYAIPGAPWVETGLLSSPEELLDLDLAALGDGRSLGLARHHEPLLLVCTNGRRDACCAELGRPLVAALHAAYPDLTWETTHLGGHRFAGAMLTLPHGLSYGRVRPDDGLRVAEATLAGELVAGLMRGRTAYPGPVQVAELTLLDRLGLRAADALELVSASESGEVTEVTFRHDGALHELVVTGLSGPAVRQSCVDVVEKPTTSYLVR